MRIKLAFLTAVISTCSLVVVSDPVGAATSDRATSFSFGGATSAESTEPSDEVEPVLSGPRQLSVKWFAAKSLPAVVSWKKPMNAGKAKLRYQLYTLEDPKVTCRTTNTSCSFALQAGITYTFQVVAIDGTGSFSAPATRIFRAPLPSYAKYAKGSCLIAQLPGMKTIDLDCGNLDDESTLVSEGIALIATDEVFQGTKMSLFGSESQSGVRGRIERSIKKLSTSLGKNFVRKGSLGLTEYEIVNQYGDRCDGYLPYNKNDSQLTEYLKANYLATCENYNFSTRNRLARKTFDPYFRVMFGPKAGDGLFPGVSVSLFFQSVLGENRIEDKKRLILVVRTNWFFCEGDC